MSLHRRFLIVGASGSGKSTLTKYLIRNMPRSRLRPYDVNGEYYKCEQCIASNTKNCSHIELPDIDDFLDKMIETRNCAIIIEEATVFFGQRSDNKKIKRILVGARHNNNMVFLIFHAIGDIPEKIYTLIDDVIVFNTSDQRHNVEEKHPRLLAAYDAVHDKKHKFKKVKITP